MNDPSVLFHIDLTLTVAMVTENGRQKRLKQTKCHFGPDIGGLLTNFLNFRYQHS